MIPFRSFLLVLFLIGSLSAFGQLQTGAPWPQYQGNNRNTGLGTNSTTNGAYNWLYSTTDSFNGSPIVGADGTIYAAGFNGGVYAIHPDGTLKWTLNIGDSYNGSPAIDKNGIIYVDGANGNITAISPSGSVDWTYNDASAVFEDSPVIGPDGTLYAVSVTGSLYMLSTGASGGRPILSRTITDHSAAAAALGSSGVLYVMGHSGHLYAITATGTNQGAIVWTDTLSTTELFNGSPAVDSSGNIYVESTSGKVYAVGPSGGTPKWINSSGSGDAFAGTPAIAANGTIYAVGATKGNLYAINSSGSLAWSFMPPGDRLIGTVAIGSNGTIYAMGQFFGVYAINPNGTLQSGYPTNDLFTGAPAIGADGTVYFEGQGGSIDAVGSFETVSRLVLSSPVVVAPIGATGTVVLPYPAPASGTVVHLVSSSTYATVPSTVTVSAGSTTATFAIATTQPPASLHPTIAASINSSTQQAIFELLTDYVVGLTLSPSVVGNAQTSTGTVSIYTPAPTGGYIVNLSTQYPTTVLVPASVTIPAGATTATFTITPKPSSASTTCGIFATDGTSGHNATLTINGDSLQSLVLSPSTIGGAQNSTGTITLTSPAPSTGWVVNLSTEYPGSVTVPASITIQPGQTTATFSITPKQLSATTLLCGVYAADGVSGKNALLTINGDSLASLTVNPVQIGGSQTATGTITLTAPAPIGGWVVNVSDEYPSSVTVPATVTIPEGQSQGVFTITPKQVSTTLNCGIYATDGNSGKNASLTIGGDSIVGLSIYSQEIGANQTATGSITLASPAPAGGWVIKISDEYPDEVSVPPTITIPAGSTTGTFSIVPKQVVGILICGIYTTDGSSGKNANMAIIGDSLTGLSLSPSTVVGGTSVTGTVTLSSEAPPGGWIVQLSTEYPSVLGVPSTLAVPFGQTSATFTLTTMPTATTYTAGVYATDGVSGQNATITVTHS